MSILSVDEFADWIRTVGKKDLPVGTFTFARNELPYPDDVLL